MVPTRVTIHTPGDYVYTMGDSGEVRAFSVGADGGTAEVHVSCALSAERGVTPPAEPPTPADAGDGS